MNRFEKFVLWGATTLVTASGTAFAILKYLVVSDDPFAVVNHPWQPFFLKLHVLSAPLLVFGVGVVFSKHIWRHWDSGTAAGRKTGATVVLMLLPMIVTGYLIQTVADTAIVRGLVVVHLVSGGSYIVAIAGHRLRTWLQARAARRDRAALTTPEAP